MCVGVFKVLKCWLGDDKGTKKAVVRLHSLHSEVKWGAHHHKKTLISWFRKPAAGKKRGHKVKSSCCFPSLSWDCLGLHLAWEDLMRKLLWSQGERGELLFIFHIPESWDVSWDQTQAHISGHNLSKYRNNMSWRDPAMPTVSSKSSNISPFWETQTVNSLGRRKCINYPLRTAPDPISWLIRLDTKVWAWDKVIWSDPCRLGSVSAQC